MHSLADGLLRLLYRCGQYFASALGSRQDPEIEQDEAVHLVVLGFRLYPLMWGTWGDVIITDRRFIYVPMDFKLTYWWSRRHAVEIPLSRITAFGERHPLHRLRGNWFLPVWFIETTEGRSYTFQSYYGYRLLTLLSALTNGVHA